MVHSAGFEPATLWFEVNKTAISVGFRIFLNVHKH